VPVSDPRAAPWSEPELDERLSRPTPGDVAAMAALDGDVLILGAGGKMGPSLARLAHRAADEAGIPRRIIAVSRFSQRGLADDLASRGIDVIAADLLDPNALAGLPETPNVIFMAGQKFGTSGEPSRTWALNAYLPATAVQRFADSRLVVFSTGNVYPLVSVRGGGSREGDTPAPVGEYAQSALALDSAVAQGADPLKVGDAFVLAADQVEPGESEVDKIKATETKKQLLSRAARIFETHAKDGERAEDVFYVTDNAQRPLDDATAEHLRARLIAALNRAN